MTRTVGSAEMSESDNSSTPLAGTGRDPPAQADDVPVVDSVTFPPSPHGAFPTSASSPARLNQGLISSTPPQDRLVAGPRLHPVHSERPNSAPPQQFEKLSAQILRTMGDHYQSSTCGRTLRMLGDQMSFESEIRRALSYGDLYMLQNRENR